MKFVGEKTQTLPELPILGSESEDFLEEKKVTLVTEIVSVIYLLSQGLVQVGLKFEIFLLLPPGCWNYTTAVHVLNLNSFFLLHRSVQMSQEKNTKLNTSLYNAWQCTWGRRGSCQLLPDLWRLLSVSFSAQAKVWN